MTNRRYLTLLIAIVVAGVFVHIRMTARSSSPEVETDSVRQKRAFDTGGFVAAAAITGTYTQVREPIAGRSKYQLSELVRTSDSVVSGRVVAARSMLTADSLNIRTHYRVAVDEIFKGTAGRTEIVVSMLGGRVSTPSGGWAQLFVRNAEMPLVGKQYVMFLLRIPPTATALEDQPGGDYWPLLGSVGIIGLGEAGESLRFLDRRKQTGVDRARDGDRPATFLQEIRRLVSTR